MKPAVLRRHDVIQLSYDLPHRTFATKTYPVRSSNGSSIIIYGHEQGLRILWYGGKPFKEPKATEQPPKVNGTSKNDPMVIDLDDDYDDPAPARPKPQVAEFQDEEDEVDPTQPYQDVLRFVDIPFGTTVLQLAIPFMPTDAGKGSPESYPPLFSDRMVVAASCGDLSIRLLTLPLTPPSPLATDPATWDVQTVKIFGSATHKEQIASISITHTAESLDSEGDGDQSKPRARSRNRLASTATETGASHDWSILVASTSCTGTGLLLIHQIPLLKNNTLASSSGVLFPIQRQFLRCSLSESVVAFNTSPFPALRHSNVLIAVPDTGCVKTYQVFPPSTYQRGRRGSAATIESSTSSAKSTHGTNTQLGRFLITLYPGFLGFEEFDSSPRRKRILDASWVLGGRAVIALMEDGEWGVWDIEAAGPSSASTTENLVKGQSNVSGIQGGSLTKFAIKAMIGLPTEPGTKPSSVSAPSSSLAPLTPYTRKMRSDGLFQGTSLKPGSAHSQSGPSYGSICVTDHQTNALAATKLPEESVILSFRDTNIFLPSILAYWRSETTGRGTFESSSSIRPSVLPPLRLGGERTHTIALLPTSMASTRTGLFGTAPPTPSLLVTTDHRLVLLGPPNSDATMLNSDGRSQSLPTRPLNPKPTSSDQLLLTQGQLDVDGMDRILSGMAGPSSRTAAGFGKSVGFQIDEDDNDVEMGMGTPTPKDQRIRINRSDPLSRAEPSRRLFS